MFYSGISHLQASVSGVGCLVFRDRILPHLSELSAGTITIVICCWTMYFQLVGAAGRFISETGVSVIEKWGSGHQIFAEYVTKIFLG